MSTLVAKRSLVYANRAIKAGESFRAVSDSDANLLVAVGAATRESAPAVASEVEPRTRGRARTRRYRRRDMQAEGTDS